MRILLTGGSGQLGRALQSTLRDLDVISSAQAAFDIKAALAGIDRKGRSTTAPIPMS